MKRRRPNQKRKAAAIVEFVICLPVLIVLVMGAIECTSMIFVDQSLNVVAYEGIRAAIKASAQPGDAMARAQQVIAERKLKSAQVTFQPSEPAGITRGTPITITVTAPCEANSVMGLDFFSTSLEAVAVMNKE